ncbi:3'-5' exonuclease domain-containing protein 2 [bacterium]|nr:3'-5' exonuclease domain-containing protein 2 [bacterium]
MKSENDPIKNNILSFQGRIHLIRSNKELLSVAEDINSAHILGFDTETRPSFKKGQIYKVALLQLSTQSDAYIIRLHEITNFESLITVFENTEIIKTGVAIRDDIITLQKAFKFEPQNFIELQTLAKKKGLTKFGLKGMSEELLKGTVTKGAKMTNWEAPILTPRQLKYAATDAWIGLKLFEKLR